MLCFAGGIYHFHLWLQQTQQEMLGLRTLPGGSTLKRGRVFSSLDVGWRWQNSVHICLGKSWPLNQCSRKIGHSVQKCDLGTAATSQLDWKGMQAWEKGIDCRLLTQNNHFSKKMQVVLNTTDCPLKMSEFQQSLKKRQTFFRTMFQVFLKLWNCPEPQNTRLLLNWLKQP